MQLVGIGLKFNREADAAVAATCHYEVQQLRVAGGGTTPRNDACSTSVTGAPRFFVKSTGHKNSRKTKKKK